MAEAGQKDQSIAADNRKWEFRFHYGERWARVAIAFAPFVFFSVLLGVIFRRILELVHASTGGPCDVKERVLPPLVQEVASHGTEFIAIVLGCITILLLASMALIARAIQRD